MLIGFISADQNDCRPVQGEPLGNDLHTRFYEFHTLTQLHDDHRLVGMHVEFLTYAYM